MPTSAPLSPSPSIKFRTITAQFPGVCAKCGEPYAARERVQYRPGESRHVECPAPRIEENEIPLLSSAESVSGLAPGKYVLSGGGARRLAIIEFEETFDEDEELEPVHVA